MIAEWFWWRPPAVRLISEIMEPLLNDVVWPIRKAHFYLSNGNHGLDRSGSWQLGIEYPNLYLLEWV